MSYEYNPADVREFAAFVGAETREHGAELQFRTCPYCKGGGSDDEYTFSVNLDKGVFKCLRATCGVQGHFVNLAHDFNYPLPDDKKEPTVYRELPQKSISSTDLAVQYMQTRGISEAITRKYRLTTRNDNENVLVFPFYDENDVLTNVKYRWMNYDKKKHKGGKEWAEGPDDWERGCKQILFGMQECKTFDRVVITEGQIDSLSLAEAGIQNAVSVPTGANGATWLNNCYDWLCQFEKVVVMGDNEHGKITLVDMLQKRINRLYVVRSADYLGCKDANDILRQYGREALVYAVENAEIQPINRIKRLCDAKQVNLAQLPKFKTGIQEIDEKLGGIYYGQLVILTGRAGEGKSTFMSQIICEALDQNLRVLAYSGELEDFQFRAWIDTQLAGKDNMSVSRNDYGKEAWSVTPSVASKIADWYSDRMYIYDNSVIEGDEHETILQTVENAIKRYDLKLVCIDNLMTAIELNDKQDFYVQQGQFATELKKLAMRYDVAIILVAHPRKTNGNIGNDDVSGSSDTVKRADVVITFGLAKEGEAHDCEAKITKSRWTGSKAVTDDPIKLIYSAESRRITSLIHGYNKHYGWERQNGYTAPESRFEEIKEDDELPW